MSVNQNDDPRIGSSRDNSSSATVTGLGPGSNSSSVSALFTTLIPVSVYAAVCIAVFLLFRPRCARVYAPRTFLSSLHPYERSLPLPSTRFSWIKAFWRIPDAHVLNHVSVDGFLFLRFLNVIRNICLFGCCLIWPVLMPTNIFGGGSEQQLDRLTFGNVSNPRLYYVHAFVAWLFFGVVLYTVCRECIYSINLRQAYLLNPFYANRLAARTVLFTCIPQVYLDEAKLRKIFGDSVKTVWIPRTSWELERLVRERDQTAARLQDAELTLVTKANNAWRRAAKQGHPDIAQPDLEHGPTELSPGTTVCSNGTDEVSNSKAGHNAIKYGLDGPPFDVPGSIAAQWIPQSARPRHRPLANFGRRVDTIRWTRKRLKKLSREIGRLRSKVGRGTAGSPLPVAFIEFTSQDEAQIAYQALAHHRPSHMAHRYIGVRPDEIIWYSLRMRWWERIIRRFGILTVTGLLTVFWSLPCAFVGTLSNINFLASSVPFLGWIEKLPGTVLGFMTGLLPALALSLLMSIVPGIMRVFARLGGAPSLTAVELFTQKAYFGFQVLQVFLVTTFTSSASASISQVIKSPLSARDLLSQSLPKASNFYLSYMVIQCLGAGAGQMVQLSRLLFHCIPQRFSRNPKVVYHRWHRLRRVHWGGIFPVFINLGIIAISYSVIAPLILGFTAIGCSLVHVTYKYNLLYVFSSETDTRGLTYTLALKQLLTGLYLAQICLLGLFGLQLAFGPVVMMFIAIVVTAVVHISLDEAVGPLMENLPRSLSAEKDVALMPDGEISAEGDKQDDSMNNLTAASFGNPYLGSDADVLGAPEVADEEQAGNKDGLDDGYNSDSSSSSDAVASNESREKKRAVEGAEGAVATSFQLLKALVKLHVSSSEPQTNKPSSTTKEVVATVSKARRLLSLLTSPPPPPPAGTPLGIEDRLKHATLSYLHPEVYSSFAILRDLIPKDCPDPGNAAEYACTAAERDAYLPPAMISGAPRVWIPDDSAAAGVGRQEVAHSGAVTGVVAKGATLDGAGRLEVDVQAHWIELVGAGTESSAQKAPWLRDPDMDWGRVRWW